MLILIVTVLGMMGGQARFPKAFRRYGISGVGIAWNLAKNKQGKEKVKYLWLALLIGLLSIGYGESSTLMRTIKRAFPKLDEYHQDLIVRLIYGLILSIPFMFLGFIWASLLLPLAFLIKVTWLPIKDFIIYKDVEFLWEDLIRYLTLGVCIQFVV